MLHQNSMQYYLLQFNIHIQNSNALNIRHIPLHIYNYLIQPLNHYDTKCQKHIN